MTSPTIRQMASVLAAAACALTAGVAAGQAYPTKPIRMIAPYPPGGTSDIVARIVGQKLTDAWGARVVVDNRPGASGSLDRKSTRLNSSHIQKSRMPSSA